ncbi:MAG TPA: hypothetical protein VNZ85_10380 [Caulobacter sp.]|nr:hypothetical protein [Caulobacter sp.]
MRRWLSVLTAVFAFATASSAHAIESKQGFIKSFYFSAPGNASFRVTLDTPLTLCTGDFVSIDTSFGNYQAFVAGLLSAQAQRKSVNLIYTVKSNGYCELLEYGFSQ